MTANLAVLRNTLYFQLLFQSPSCFEVLNTSVARSVLTAISLFQVKKSLSHKPTGKCLDREESVRTVFLSACDPLKTTQQWEVNKVGS